MSMKAGELSLNACIHEDRGPIFNLLSRTIAKIKVCDMNYDV